MNGGLPMWSLEHDCVIAKQSKRKGYWVWGSWESRVVLVKGNLLSPFSGNCFWESPNGLMSVTKSQAPIIPQM